MTAPSAEPRHRAVEEREDAVLPDLARRRRARPSASTLPAIDAPARRSASPSCRPPFPAVPSPPARRRRPASCPRHRPVDLGRVHVERDGDERIEPPIPLQVVQRQRAGILRHRAHDQQQRGEHQRDAELVAARLTQHRAEGRGRNRRRRLGREHVELDLAARHAQAGVGRQHQRRLGASEVGAQRQRLHRRQQLGAHRGRQVEREPARQRLDQHVARAAPAPPGDTPGSRARRRRAPRRR